jgi:serine/threonine protein kinase
MSVIDKFSKQPLNSPVNEVNNDTVDLSKNEFPSRLLLNSNSDIEIYNKVAGACTFQERASTGSSADLEDIGSTQIRKTDKVGEPNLIDLEAEMYMKLEDLGFEHMPKSYDLSQDYIDIQRLDYGTSLYDFAEAAAAGIISEKKWVEICKVCNDIIENFHDLDMIHGDLHPGNIVIILDKEKGFQPYLIDFAFSTHLDDVEQKVETLDDRGVRFTDDYDFSQKGDITRLTDSLYAMFPDVSVGFSSGVRELGG